MTERIELQDMIQYDTEYGYFEKLKTQKDVRKFLKDLREENDGEMQEYSSLYVLYKNGDEITVFEDENIAKLKYTGIERMIYSADYGDTFYNAFPQMDTFGEENDDWNWMIRIGCTEDEYDFPADLEQYV